MTKFIIMPKSYNYLFLYEENKRKKVIEQAQNIRNQYYFAYDFQ